MQLTRSTSQHVDVTSNALNAGCIIEVRRANTLANDIPVASVGDTRDLLLFHHLQELLSNISNTFHGTVVEIVAFTPRLAVLSSLPLQEYVEIGEMVALGDAEIGMDIVSFFLLLGRTVENLLVRDSVE